MTEHLDLMRDSARSFPQVEAPESIKTARIWHCKYKTLESLGAFVGLKELTIASYPDDSLDLLLPLLGLERLEILHMPRVTTLSPLRRLQALRNVVLQTLPSWDSSGRVTEVESLEPLVELPRLEELRLFGVVPKGRTVDQLFRSQSLRQVQISKFAKGEAERLASWVEAQRVARV